MLESKDAETRAWRAQFLYEAATRLDRHIEKMKKQAAEYRDLAQRINPTST